MPVTPVWLYGFGWFRLRFVVTLRCWILYVVCYVWFVVTLYHVCVGCSLFPVALVVGLVTFRSGCAVAFDLFTHVYRWLRLRTVVVHLPVHVVTVDFGYVAFCCWLFTSVTRFARLRLRCLRTFTVCTFRWLPVTFVAGWLRLHAFTYLRYTYVVTHVTLRLFVTFIYSVGLVVYVRLRLLRLRLRTFTFVCVTRCGLLRSHVAFVTLYARYVYVFRISFVSLHVRCYVYVRFCCSRWSRC